MNLNEIKGDVATLDLVVAFPLALLGRESLCMEEGDA
jgi:hypothetical protein